MMTLREQWLENRRRRLAGLPEVTREGYEIPKRPPQAPWAPAQAETVYRETLETYNPQSKSYRRYQGD